MDSTVEIEKDSLEVDLTSTKGVNTSIYLYFTVCLVITIYFLRKYFFNRPVEATSTNDSFRKECLRAVREKMQEKYDAEVEEYKIKKAEKEKLLAQEKIEKHEKFVSGQSMAYRRDEDDRSCAIPNKNKKKPLRPDNYNPLMGEASSCCYRPNSRFASQGGG